METNIAADLKLSHGVFGDFEISRHEDGSLWELGRGAMGTTYRAVDNVLKRTVALKVIETRPDADGAPTIRERFLREARVAAGLHHPNVAEVFRFEALPETDCCYYAMELVSGETLEARVRRDGPLNVALSLETGIQVARALVAAAEKGLIHRDLKPANIMVSDRDGPLQVKVIDFGLAKAVNKESLEMESTHGGFVGTPTFASPEQFRGMAADARSDIYSLGVTLWYALTGEVPHPGKSIEEIRQSRELTDLPVQHLFDRSVPLPLIALLQCALSPDPAARPQSATALLAELEACKSTLALEPRRRKRRIVAALALTVLVLAAIAGVKNWANRRATRPIYSADRSIAILPFESLGKNERDAFFAAGIQEEIQSNLAKRNGLRVAGETSTMAFQTPNRLSAHEIGQKLGVEYLLEATVSRDGNRSVVVLRLVDTRSGGEIWTRNLESRATDSPTIAGELASAIAAALAPDLTPDEVALGGRAPTLNPEAYEEYLRGIAREARENILHEELDERVRAYENAVRLDPSFALAWARLSRAHSQTYWYHEDFTESRMARAKHALDRATELQPELGETYLARGYFHLWCERNFQAAINDFSEARRRLPNSAEVLKSLGLAERRSGRWLDAAKHYEQSAVLDPLDKLGLQQWGVILEALQRFPEERTAINRVIAFAPDEPRWVLWKARTHLLQGELEVASNLVETTMPKGLTCDLMWMARSVWFYERNYQKVIASCTDDLQRLSMVDGYLVDVTIELANAQKWSGDEAGARSSYTKAREWLEEGLAADPDAHLACAKLAVVFAGLGDRGAALRNAERAVSLKDGDFMDRPHLEVNLAQVYAQLGDAGMAVANLPRLLRTASSGLTYAALKLDPVWDPIRSDARFQSLLASTPPDDAARISRSELPSIR